jgi:hypothetical protein
MRERLQRPADADKGTRFEEWAAILTRVTPLRIALTLYRSGQTHTLHLNEAKTRNSGSTKISVTQTAKAWDIRSRLPLVASIHASQFLFNRLTIVADLCDGGSYFFFRPAKLL